MAEFILIHGIRVAKDFTPESFGRLTTLGPKFRMGRRYYVVCQCECGGTVVVDIDHCKSGRTSSCGCIRKEQAKLRATTHGMCGTQTYGSWYSMIQRTTNPKKREFRYWGGRGIKVCDHWQRFENFFEDMGECPTGHSLDRIDNSKGYEPGNCRWATSIEQSRNTRKNRILTIDGVSRCMAEWAEQPNASKYTTIQRRLLSGWVDKDAVFGKPKNNCIESNEG